MEKRASLEHNRWSCKWPTSDQLEKNKKNLISKLRKLIDGYESKFSIRSDDVIKEFEAGRLHETQEICEWMIIFDIYQRLIKEK